MLKEIRYGGVSAVPSSYDCPDGDLDISLNLIHEDGALRPIAAPAPVMRLAEGERVVCVHNAGGIRHFIVASGDISESFTLSCVDEGAASTSGASRIGSFSGLRDAAPVGNTLVLALDSGMHYLLWKDGVYKDLGTRPPFVPIEFGLYKKGKLTDTEYFNVPKPCSPTWNTGGGNATIRRAATEEEREQYTQSVYGLLLSSLEESVTSRGLFYQPFFVRYAFRLFDGSYNWHSSPVLMLPTVVAPIVRYLKEDGNIDDASEYGAVKAQLALNVDYFALAYRILSHSSTLLAEWSDIVAGIDVFISAPVYTYNQSKTLDVRPTRTMDAFISAYCKERVDVETPATGDSDTGNHRGGSYQTLPDKVFVGHYADSVAGKYVDRVFDKSNASSYGHVVCLRPNEHFMSDIQSAHDFFRVASIDIADIREMTVMSDLKIEEPDLANLVTRPVLPDDYQSHATLIPGALYGYNSRLNAADMSIMPAEPFPLRVLVQHGNPDGISFQQTRIRVWMRTGGVRTVAVHTGAAGVPGISPDTWYNPSANRPRFLFYPDASAYKLEISAPGSPMLTYDLKPHDFLNGAYWFDDRSLFYDPAPSAAPETADCAALAPVKSKLYTSDVGNPFLFSVQNIVTVGSGRILGMASASIALSQGQFGSFPLYAFTDEGVWALSVSQTGGWSAVQPLSRDVCVCAAGIVQTDSSVLFPSARGYMAVSGSRVECLTEAVDSDFPLDVSSLPAYSQLCSLAGLVSPAQAAVPPFSDFLSSCRAVYDYAGQRVVFFAPARPVAYVFSMRSKRWGMMASRIVSAVKSYPGALAVDLSGNLVDFSPESDLYPQQLAVTRPLKLDAPDVLKTVDTVLLRGFFASADVGVALYGSTDLRSWHLVASASGSRLGNFRGSPYKYFRIVIVGRLRGGDSLSGCSVNFNPRFIRRLR